MAASGSGLPGTVEEHGGHRGREAVENQSLAYLQAHLVQVEAQQRAMRAAIAENKSVVFRGRQHHRTAAQQLASAPPMEPLPPTPKAAPMHNNVISGGFTGFVVAEDLVHINFDEVHKDDEPKEFKASTALPFVIEFNPAVGGYGPVEPGSGDFSAYMARLEEQHYQVMKALARTNPDHKPAPPAPAPVLNVVYEAPPIAPPRQPKVPPEPEREYRAPPAVLVAPSTPVYPGQLDYAGEAEVAPAPAAVAANPQLPPVRIARFQPGPKPQLTPEEMPKWRRPVIIDQFIKFGHVQQFGGPGSRPSAIAWCGWAAMLFWLAAFAFYTYVRVARTLTRDYLFAYQVVFLVVELLVGVMTFRHGLSRLRRLLGPAELARIHANDVYGKRHSQEGNAAAPGPSAVAGVSAAVAVAGRSSDAGGRASGAGEPPGGKKGAKLKRKYHSQVMVHAETADLAALEATLQAAFDAQLPPGCTRVVYLVDPARDAGKAALVATLALDGVIYMPGPEAFGADRSRFANINRVLRKLYPRHVEVKNTELVVVLDAHDIVQPDFFLQALPPLETKGVRLVHGRPTCRNLSASSDVLDLLHHTTYSQLPGFEAGGWAYCSQSAFVVRADALKLAGWLPTYSNCEAPALAAELKLRGHLSFFLDQPLAIGAAPEAYGGMLAAKRGEARGLVQTYFRLRPAGTGRADLCQHLRNGNAGSALLLSCLSTPVFVGVPIVQVWFGQFPLQLNRWFGIAFVAYYLLATPILYRAYRPSNLQGLWHSTTAAVACWAVHVSATIVGFCCGRKADAASREGGATSKGRWKPTAAQGGPPKKRASRNGTHPDMRSFGDADAAEGVEGAEAEEEEGSQPEVVDPTSPPSPQLSPVHHRRAGCDCCGVALTVPYIAALISFLSLGSAAIGAWLLFGTAGIANAPATSINLSILAANLPLFASTLWCLVNGLAAALPLLRWLRLRRRGLAITSVAALAVTVAATIAVAVACIGLGHGFSYGGFKTYAGARDYDYGSSLSQAYRFLEAQRSGQLPSNNAISWRGDSALSDLPVGGFYEGSTNLKLTFPIAVTTSLMAWGLVASPMATSAAGITHQVYEDLRWATQYLMACQNGSIFVGQVGDLNVEQAAWQPPEDIPSGIARPHWAVTSNIQGIAGSDLLAEAAAALAASSMAFRIQDQAYSKTLLVAAQSLYAMAAGNLGGYASSVPAAALYPAGGFYDDLAYAAAWLSKATSDAGMLSAAQGWWLKHRQLETDWQSPVPSSANMYWAATALLAQLTGQHVYVDAMQGVMDVWTGAVASNGVTQTPLKLSWTAGNRPLQNAANAAQLALLHGQFIGGTQGKKWQCWGRSQVRYMLGAGGRSYVVGVGPNPPTRPASPAASCSDLPIYNATCTTPRVDSPAYLSPNPNPKVIAGALVGGPNVMDQFQDVRSSFADAISVDANGGFTGALTVLAGQSDWQAACDARQSFLAQLGVRIPRV